MVTLIVGNKGSGKTKKLINLTNKAIEESNGNVVVVEKGTKLTYDISHKARLINTDQFNIEGFDTFYGFISGICAGNYDVTHVLIDSTLKIGGNDMEGLVDFINKVDKIASKTDTKFAISVSCAESDIKDKIGVEINRV